jgi:SOS-response transcriptional repressor LexA
MNRIAHMPIWAENMRVGRQLKYGEPTVKREFRLPESLNDLLTRVARERDANLSEVLVKALRAELEGEKPSTPGVETQDIEQVLRALLKPEMLRDADDSNNHKEEVLEQPRPALSPLPEKYQKLMPSHLPVYKLSGKVSAGSWREAIEDPQFLTARDLLSWQNDDEDFLLEINPDDGECLTGDGISPGDYVHMRSTAEADNGDIVLAVGCDVEGAPFATLKHWHRRGNRVELRPSNDKCKMIVAHVKEVEIHGVVMGLIKHSFKRTKKKTK